MAEKRNIEYDSDAVFISYSPEDIDWAEDELRPRLEKSGVKVITSENLTTGATKSLNLEQVIADTRRTIVVLSPEWVANSWNGFEADMLVHLDPAAIKRKLLPVLLRKTEIPPRIARLTIRELTDKKRYESRLAQLIRDVEDSVPPPPRENFPNPWEWYWRQARRRGATPGRVVALCAGLLLGLLVAGQIWPFQPRQVWLEDAVVPRVAVVHYSDTALVAGAFQNLDACPPPEAPDKGLWFRSLTEGGEWQPSQIPGRLLCQPQKPDLSNINRLASHPNEPDTVYALNSHNGLVISRDGGRSFNAFEPPIPPFSVASQPVGLAVGGTRNQPILWISGKDRGVWRLLETDWEQIARESSECPMPVDIKVWALLAQDDWLLAGSTQQGLWRVQGDGCQRLDASGDGEQVDYRFLWAVPSAHNRYLAVVRVPDPPQGDTRGKFRLVIVCPQPGDCDEAGRWKTETESSLWDGSIVEDILVRESSPGMYEWYLADQFGHIWQGDLIGIEKRAYPTITRCRFLSCRSSLAWLPDKGLYVLANRIPLLDDKPTTDGHFYLFGRGPWYRRVWP
jgi:hypothetical protein